MWKGRGELYGFGNYCTNKIISWFIIPPDTDDNNTAKRISRSHWGKSKENSQCSCEDKNFHVHSKLSFWFMLKLVFNFSNEELHEGLISVFFSRYGLAVKVEARSRHPKDPFECKNTTHNSQLVTKPGEGALEPTPIRSNCLHLSCFPLACWAQLKKKDALPWISACTEHAGQQNAKEKNHKDQ